MSVPLERGKHQKEKMLPLAIMCLIFAAPMLTLLVTAYTSLGSGRRRQYQRQRERRIMQ